MDENRSLFYCPTPHTLVGYVLAPIISLEFIFGLAGNGLALWVFCFRVKVWKTYMVYMLNLVISDLLLIIFLPFRIDNYTRGEDWVFSETFCGVNLLMLAMNRTASICFLTAITMDRYFKVVHPNHRFNIITLTGAVKVAVVLWIWTALMSMHLVNAKLVQRSENKTLCRSYSSYEQTTPDMIWHGVLFFMEFLVAFSLIIFCTCRIVCKLRGTKAGTQGKIRSITRLVILIVIEFAICFMPSIVSAVLALGVKTLYPKNCGKFFIYGSLFHGTFAFTYLNSVLDPVIYCFSSRSFKQSYRKTLRSVRPRKIEFSEGNEKRSNGRETFQQSLERL
ncbi:hydroxycarboxylic acid receptor 2 [Amia ocellicauda]|uniref:hydroxycarboxylic acid receptor 2 n=1 Tax=Amia ocellicauda TaxID=2972642 RepID=UPI0034649B1C